MGERLAATRTLTLDLVAPLSDADATIQPFPDASPAKWHLAHTTWFFETFVLRNRGHAPFDERFAYLFNSYYEAEGDRHARPKRGMLSRPSLDEIRAWRAHVDEALDSVLPGLDERGLKVVELGIQHEQQHQELLLTDILATFAENPLEPAYFCYCEAPKETRQSSAGEGGLLPPAQGRGGNGGGEWLQHAGGTVMIGAEETGFAFDCERPCHRALLHPHALASLPVSNAEWEQFIVDGGYATPTLWLSEGWAWVRENAIEAPLYWRPDGTHFTLAGRVARDPAAPVAHISYYEADAFARWAGARLPREEEWENAAKGAGASEGQQLDGRDWVVPTEKTGMFGSVWEWTASAFLPYPGFVTEAGAIGEYNGKFMRGQFVLKGASCATPRGHSRASYRNFFPPSARWQFTGVRLARDA
ncbi:MAG: ergothioneine biosynthesis protein EgtB [Sphingomonadales bacterium]|nr:ergothioneine biosynthesis protein EgtB [Sphingomonadales bacterium]